MHVPLFLWQQSIQQSTITDDGSVTRGEIGNQHLEFSRVCLCRFIHNSLKSLVLTLICSSLFLFARCTIDKCCQAHQSSSFWLSFVAVCCSVFQYVCSMLQCVAVCCSALQRVVLCCGSILYCMQLEYKDEYFHITYLHTYIYI